MFSVALVHTAKFYFHCHQGLMLNLLKLVNNQKLRNTKESQYYVK